MPDEIQFHDDKSWSHFLNTRVQFHEGGENGHPDKNDVSYYVLALDTDKGKSKMNNIKTAFKIERPFFFKATHYKTINHEELIKTGNLDQEYAKKRLKEKNRVVAIHVSHCAALKHFLDNGQSKWAMFFEEDASFPKGPEYAKRETLAYLKEAEERLDPMAPQLHYIGHCWAPASGDLISERIVKGNVDLQNPKCRHAYIVNQAGAKQLLKDSWPMNDNGDEMWALVDYFYFHDEGGIIMQNEQDFPDNAIRKKTKTENLTVEKNSEKDKKLDPVVLTLLVLVLVLAVGYWIFKKSCRLGAMIIGVIALIFIVTGVATEKIIYKEKMGAKDYERILDDQQAKTLKKGVTAVVLNYNRPHNMKGCIEPLREDPDIDKVILMNGKLETKVVMHAPDVLEIDDFSNNEKYGGARRFLVDPHFIETEHVLFIDDDVAMKPGQVGQMLKKMEEGELLVGPRCRECNRKGYFTKTTKPDTVLTSTMMLPKRVLVDYQASFPSAYKAFLVETHGNGEDLSMNHFVRTNYPNARAYCINLKTKELDSSSGYSSKAGHMAKRDEICKTLF